MYKETQLFIESEDPNLFKYSLFENCPEPESLDYHLCDDNYFRTDMKLPILNPLSYKLKVRPTKDKLLTETAENVIDGYTKADKHVFYATLEPTESNNLFFSTSYYCHSFKKSIILFNFSPDGKMLYCTLFKNFTPENKRELFFSEFLRATNY